jgi:hypothetical protein
MKRIIESIINLWKFRKVVWDWRWYDYSYQLDVIVFQLQELEKVWGKKTHYVGDSFTTKRIKVVLKYYKEYKDTDDIEKEYKALQKFLNAYTKLLPRLWD